MEIDHFELRSRAIKHFLDRANAKRSLYKGVFPANVITRIAIRYGENPCQTAGDEIIRIAKMIKNLDKNKIMILLKEFGRE